MNTRVTSMLLLCALAACDDGTGPNNVTGREFGLVVNSQDRTLSIFPVDSPQVVTSIGLGPDGSPVSVAVRNNLAVVPLGFFPAAAVVDLVQRRVVHTVPLPANSGATGAAFVNDSIALIGNSNLNSVTPINVLRGTSAAALSTGGYPQAIIAARDTAYVLNAELGPDFNPARNGTITVITGTPSRVAGTINLSGTNPGAATFARDGVLYVVNSGSFGANNGSLSAVDRRTLNETRRDTGFGEFPGGVSAGTDGRLYVASFAFGLAIWDPAARTFVRSPASAVQPGGIGSSAGSAVDGSGRVYALKPDCRNRSVVYRLTATFTVESEIPVGICPIAIAFTHLQSN